MRLQCAFFEELKSQLISSDGYMGSIAQHWFNTMFEQTMEDRVSDNPVEV